MLGPIMPSSPLLDDRIAALLAPPAKRARVPGSARLPLPAAPPPPPPPARPPAPQAAAQQQSRKAAQSRLADEAPARDVRPPPAGWDEGGVPVVVERDGGGSQDGGGDGEEGGCFALDAAPLPLDDGLTPAEIAALLPGAEASGVFEVLLPDGSALGVAVDVSADTVCYLLTPESDTLAARLRRQQMELAGQVERRIGRSVRLTVL
ncbi:hypothetical protein IP92_05467 [Pseudoduganella flava]|uniref:Flagellar hook-length control protein FliK n=1 Tax=Pseudoduganella flava TaxID=871742 RepID=A0A562PDI0_9BURK|nr:hypothetical protein [Pseudoduganella flava]QGZ42136.1 hypothetical protein GO485_25890 [Pseudoduganella flava]TWI42491.1 hypothetical protein IP92_05467 [Pseudoduganella flava]